MGSWGHEAFQNDPALDWADELSTADDLSLVLRTLQTVIETPDYVEDDEASAAIAAAEVVALLKGAPKTPLPERITAWAAVHPVIVDSALLQLAQQAVHRVVEDSELRDQWEDSPDRDRWLSSVQDLFARLQG
jgi:hypothetical protein